MEENRNNKNDIVFGTHNIEDENIKKQLEEERTASENIKLFTYNEKEKSHSGLFSKDSISVLLAPPRLFPSLKWFAFLKQFDVWIPTTGQNLPIEWLDVNLGKRRLNKFPIESGFGLVDSWTFSINPNNTKGFERWKKRWVSELKKNLGHFKHYDEAEEILLQQLNLAISDYVDKKSKEQSMDAVEPGFTLYPVITSMMVNSTNRIGTGFVQKLSDWPSYIWQDQLTVDDRLREVALEKQKSMPNYFVLPDSPIPCKSDQEVIDYYIEPLNICLRQMPGDTNSEAREVELTFYVDGMSAGREGEIIIARGYDNFDVELLGSKNDIEMIFRERSILCDIAEFGLMGLEKKANVILENTCLQKKKETTKWV